MKFKYHYLENKLWKIEENYSYEISEESREHLVYIGTKTSFRLGENHYLILRIIKPALKITVYYIKPSKNGESVYYEKEMTLGWFQTEITFEFTKADRVEK